jgi:hypothetical protein
MYMEWPKGFIQKDREKSICRLKKGLCGTKQAPRQWYKKFDSFMHGRGSKRLNADRCIHIKRDKKKKNGNFIVLLLYIDDMLIFGKDKLMIKGDKIIIKQRLCVETLSFLKECACATSQYCALGQEVLPHDTKM